MNMLIMNPEHNLDIFVDHIDGDTLNNRRSNLRVTVPQKNSTNRKTRNSNNQTGYRNVAYITSSKHPYHVQISINGKNTKLGKFDDVDEAGMFAEEMRKKYYKDYAGSN